MKTNLILRTTLLLAAMAARSFGQSLPDLYFTNAVVLSNGLGQFEVRTPDTTTPYALLYSYDWDFCYLPGTPRWSVWMALNSATNRYVITTPTPISDIGTIFLGAAPLGQPLYWLSYEISSFGPLASGVPVVSWPKQPDRWWLELTAANGTNFPAADSVFFTGPAGTVTNAMAQDGGGSTRSYKHYYGLLGPGLAPPGGTWYVQYSTQALVFAMADPQVSSRYAVMVPNVVVSNGLLVSVSWTYHNPTTGAILPGVPQYVAGSKSVTLQDINDNNIYDSPPADRTRTNHLFSSAIQWSSVGFLNIGYHDSLGNLFRFAYLK